MELGSLIGFIAGLMFILLSMLFGTHFNFGTIGNAFVDMPSIMITIGGTVAATLIAIPFSKLGNSLKTIGLVFKAPEANQSVAIGKIIDLANLARKEGILVLEEAARSMDDLFLQKGIMLIVDGTDPELVRSILETEMVYIEGRHKDSIGVWEYIGSASPAWGMIGTLIGLILMLQDMSDPSALGPSMAVAMITTFYGSVIANYLAAPVANKLKAFNAEEMLMKEILIEGMLSIQAGENPRIIEEKLKAFLSPKIRATIGEGAGKAGDE